MITTIDNSERVFQIVNENDFTQIFCNLTDLNRAVINNMLEGYFSIYTFWNNKPRRVSKRTLKEMFEANGIEQQFKY